MFGYIIQTEKVDQLFRMLTTVINVRIVFFDMDHRKIEEFDTIEDSQFCTLLRRDPEFDGRCTTGDIYHLDYARQHRKVHIYTCHCGLTEAVVPMFTEQSAYLGAIMFGQVRREGQRSACDDSDVVELYNTLPILSDKKVLHFAGMLKILGEYMIQNSLLYRAEAPWTKTVRTYIQEHLGEKVTIQELSHATGKSPSFISHHFKKAFGQTPRCYIEEQRMNVARTMLREGHSVKEIGIILGYCDEFHFSKAFKARHGICPSYFKRNEQEHATSCLKLGSDHG